MKSTSRTLKCGCSQQCHNACGSPRTCLFMVSMCPSPNSPQASMWFHFKEAPAIIFWRTVFRLLELALLSKDLEMPGYFGGEGPITNAGDGWELKKENNNDPKTQLLCFQIKEHRCSLHCRSQLQLPSEELCLTFTPLWSCLSTPLRVSLRSTSAIIPYTQILVLGELPLPLLLCYPWQGMHLLYDSRSCQLPSTCLTSTSTLKSLMWRLGHYSEEWDCEIWDGRYLDISDKTE